MDVMQLMMQTMDQQGMMATASPFERNPAMNMTLSLAPIVSLLAGILILRDRGC